MPISQFNGLPRGGKTYHAMLTKALEAARTGHRILTNIEGINAGALSALVGGRHVEVVQVDDELWNDPTIYPETINGEVNPASHPEIQIRGGDYLIIDEVHGIWKASNRVADELHPRIAKFFRYHGKYAGGPLNHSIEICLITHSPEDLPASIRRVVDATYLLISMRNYGFAARYRGVKYARDQHLESAKLGRIGGLRGLPIEPRIYNTYRSFSHEEGGEVGAAAVSGQFKLALAMVFGGMLLAVGLAWYGLSGIEPATAEPSQIASVASTEPLPPELAMQVPDAVPLPSGGPSGGLVGHMPPASPAEPYRVARIDYGPPAYGVASAPQGDPSYGLMPPASVEVAQEPEKPRERVYPESVHIEADLAKLVANEIERAPGSNRYGSYTSPDD